MIMIMMFITVLYSVLPLVPVLVPRTDNNGAVSWVGKCPARYNFKEKFCATNLKCQ